VVHFAYLALLATPLFVKKGKSSFENSAPLAVISSAHFGFQLLAGIIFMLIRLEGYKFIVVFYIITIAIYLIAFFYVLSVNGRTEAAVERRASEIYYIRNYASKVKMMIGRYMGGRLDARLERLYDELYTSPTKSIPAVADIESDIAFKIGELERAVRAEKAEDAETIINDVLYLIEDRNRILRNNY